MHPIHFCIGPFEVGTSGLWLILLVPAKVGRGSMSQRSQGL